MNNGIITVAFGREYDELGARCFAHSRKNHDLPVMVLSNIPAGERSDKWPHDTMFTFCDAAQDMNRAYKTGMNAFSPFDKTVFVDADAIIQRRGIEKIFDKIPDDGLVLQQYSRWDRVRQVPALYRLAMDNAGCCLPMTIYYGAMIAFGRGYETGLFFDLWSKLWELNGSGREMPALACAVEKSGIRRVSMSRASGFFSWPIAGHVVVQHEYHGKIRKLVGMPEFRAHKPFDKKEDWKRGAS